MQLPFMGQHFLVSAFPRPVFGLASEDSLMKLLHKTNIHCDNKSQQAEPDPMVLCLRGQNVLYSKEYNLICNEMLKENNCLKARKISLPRISCLF